MAIVVLVLMWVLIVRYSIGAGYHPGMWMAPYGAVCGLSMLTMSGMSPGKAMLSGVFSAAFLWIWLTLMDKTEGVSLLWWPLFFSGLLIPVWVILTVSVFIP